MIWNNEFETLPPEALEALQLKRLKNIVEKIYATVPFYRQRFSEYGITPDNIKSLSDLQKLPFTTKQDLRDNYPFGMFAVPKEQVVRIHASSGTTGKPTVVGYTKRDVENWAELMARTFSAAGVQKGDVLQNAYGYGLFTGGLGAHYGAELLGASVIPISGGNSKKQIMIMKDFGTTAVSCTPSYALNLYEVAKEEGIDLKDLPVKVGVFGAEPWTYSMRKEIEDKWNIDALDVYGLSEVIGPGVGFECLEAKKGMHINEDHFIVEIIDPETGEVKPYGEEGEMVFTSITKEASPIIRYRTRDITRLIKEPCLCGRTFARMEKVTGRTDDMIIIRGVNVFPSQIESILMETKGTLSHYQLVVDRVHNLDTLEVWVEVGEEFFSDEIKVLQQFAKSLERNIKDIIGITAKVKLVEPKTLERSQGKTQRVIDKRK